MDHNDAYRYGRQHTTREDQVLDLIKEYHYFTPAMQGLGITRVRDVTEAAIGQSAEMAALTGRASVPMPKLPIHLGTLLRHLGRQLRDGHRVAPGTAMATALGMSLAEPPRKPTHEPEGAEATGSAPDEGIGWHVALPRFFG